MQHKNDDQVLTSCKLSKLSKRLFKKIIRIVMIGCKVEARHDRNFDVLLRTIEHTVRGWKDG